ncbi:MAG: hypothetical protein JNL73_17430 [Anaerolineales bacterium]|nr:hypothetical protein [Anaerolineales bacterium]
MSSTPAHPPRYSVKIHPVREVRLVGRADLLYWRRVLEAEALTPLETDAQAVLMVTASASRWWGQAFCECTVSVAIASPDDPTTLRAQYLVQAFNSLAAFAWVERTLFRTPYAHGIVELDPTPPCRLSLAQNGRVVFEARTRQAPTDVAPVDDVWEGPIQLPGSPARHFMARLEGTLHAYPFRAGADEIHIAPAPNDSIFRRLSDSGFVGRQWLTGVAGTHARSETRAGRSA